MMLAVGDRLSMAPRPRSVTRRRSERSSYAGDVQPRREVRARVQRPVEPRTAREQFWPAHAKITVRRNSTAMSRPVSPTRDVGDADDIEALRKELRRLAVLSALAAVRDAETCRCGSEGAREKERRDPQANATVV